MIYCDTSLHVSALTEEGASVASRRWLARHLADDLAISGWVQTEMAGAVALKTRRGDLDPSSRARVVRVWAAAQPSFVVVPIEARHFRRAADLLLDPLSRLRSGDALHLAVALELGCLIATLDRDLHEAALRYGVASNAIDAP